MKIKIIALSAATLFAGAPAAFPQGMSGKPPEHDVQHKLSKKHHLSVSGFASYGEVQVGPNKAHRGVFGYETEQSRQAGGGGGGGGGGM